MTLSVRPLDASHVGVLSDILIETVAGNGSVGFMHPLSADAARTYWKDAFASMARGERVVLGAFDKEQLLGSVTLVLKLAESMPHRAEITKFIVSPRARGKGVGALLLNALEDAARRQGRNHILLDTAVTEGASSLYERHGYTAIADIPDYALKPLGGLTDTRLFFKRL